LRVKGFDGLRGLAVTMVFLEHFVLSGLGLGSLGVSAFFVLSGYLIIGILHQQRVKIESGISNFSYEFRKFWERRVRRIFPIYFLVLVILSIKFMIRSKSINTEGLLWYFPFLSNIYIGHIAKDWGAFTHLWSISVEQHFYLLTSPLLLLLPSQLHTKILVLALLNALLAFGYGIFMGTEAVTLYVSSIINFAYMAVGGLIAIKYKKNDDAWIYAVLTILAISLCIYIKTSATELPKLSLTILFISSLVGCASLIKYVTAIQIGGPLLYILELPPMKRLGEISYGFYVYHYFFMPIKTPPKFIPIHLIPFWTLIIFLVTVLVSWFSYKYFELKVLKRGH
jgi:peptidoglycan/LPS O-acetylase OafA/YrhL